MKYYLIVGETSGELHASHLMRSLKYYDNKAQFRFIGGDLMQREGGVRVRHYKEMAYMGFIPVLMHLRTIFRNMDMVKRDIVKWQPDVVILVDYAGFNLNIAKYLKKNTNIPVYYYISPKIWAWKEHRIKAIKRDVDEMFSILPFEVDFFEKKHNYPIHYVGNPTADEVRLFCKNYNTQRKNFLRKRRLHPYKPIIALLAGSRKQEIKDKFEEGHKIFVQASSMKRNLEERNNVLFSTATLNVIKAQRQVAMEFASMYKDFDLSQIDSIDLNSIKDNSLK